MAHQVTRWTVIAAAVAALAGGEPALAAVTTTGSIGAYPVFLPIGPGSTDLGAGNTLQIGAGGAGGLLVNAGDWLSVGGLTLGDGQTGIGTGVLSGAGSLVSLVGDGNMNRLQVGNWGTGSLTVSGGAALDGRANAAACLTGGGWCNNFIGNAAGSDATLTVTGVGSSVSLLQAFVVGGVGANQPPATAFSFGSPGADTTGRVNVLAGAVLTTDGAALGVSPGGASALGTERSFAQVVVDGTGSIWRVTGGTLNPGSAFIDLAEHASATASLAITDGGRVQIEGQSGRYNWVEVGQRGGQGTLTISGAGSALAFSGDAGALEVGRHGATGQMHVEAGWQASGMFYASVGRDGGNGTLVVDGTGSRILVDGHSSAAANGVETGPLFEIGRSGTGVVTVSNGGHIELVVNPNFAQGSSLNIGRDAVSSGTLVISGAGSVVSLNSASLVPGGGAGEASNPQMRVGREGTGTLNITGGGKLLMDGQAFSTVANSRSTTLIIGGVSDTASGGQGTAWVSGAGSEIRMTGVDTYIGVGQGPQAVGQLTVADQANVSAIGMNVGRSGGVGVVNVDAASLSFSGQQTGNTLSGAFLSIGCSSGTGAVHLTNGATVTLTNAGNLGASVNLGGSSAGPLGDGTLTMTGSSRLSVVAPAGKASLTVGRDGNGLMSVTGGSSVDVTDGFAYVGRLASSTGTLVISQGSSLSTHWVGVGRDRVNGVDVDGGSGTLLVNNSTLTADQIVIGTRGYLGGNGGLIVGAVTNHGTLNPGNSPGTMRIDGSFTAAADGRLILEVQADGAGGFKTDSLVFGQGTMLDLSHLVVQFHFLGGTDPNAFQASGGFNVDTFFQIAGAGGGTLGLDRQAFAGASFSAYADAYRFSSFSFAPDAGAVFQAQAVPEPAVGWLMLGGLGVLGGVARRRRVQWLAPAARARASC